MRDTASLRREKQKLNSTATAVEMVEYMHPHLMSKVNALKTLSKHLSKHSSVTSSEVQLVAQRKDNLRG